MFPRGGASNLNVLSFPIGGLIKSNIGSPSHLVAHVPTWMMKLNIAQMLPIAGPSKPKALTFPIGGLLKTHIGSYFQ
jgi:hypothetical protein